MATAANIVIDQGCTFNLTLDLFIDSTTDVELTGYSARGTLRKSYGSSVSVPFTVQIIPDTYGEVMISLTSEQTAALKPGRYVFDVEIYNSDSPPDINRILEGGAEVTASVTNAYPTGEGIGDESPSS